MNSEWAWAHRLPYHWPHLWEACKPKPQINICSGVGKQYLARARWYGTRRFFPLGKWTRSYRKAVRQLADEMARAGSNYTRGEVLMVAEYYDPIVLLEMVRR